MTCVICFAIDRHLFSAVVCHWLGKKRTSFVHFNALLRIPLCIVIAYDNTKGRIMCVLHTETEMARGIHNNFQRACYMIIYSYCLFCIHTDMERINEISNWNVWFIKKRFCLVNNLFPNGEKNLLMSMQMNKVINNFCFCWNVYLCLMHSGTGYEIHCNICNVSYIFVY